MDRPVHDLLGARRDRRRTAAAPCRVPARRHRLAGASRLSRRAVAQHHRNIIANAAFVAVDHPGRTFISLAVFFRHVGLVDEELSPRLRELATTRVLDRARVLGAALRVAYLVSASTTGVLPKTPMVVERGRLVLSFDKSLKALAGERVFVRLRQLARLIGREPVMETA